MSQEKSSVVKGALASKKFWYTVSGVLVVVATHAFDLPEEVAQQIVYAVLALVVGQGLADFGKEKK
tara:strand:+ start:226 stop:423 length:198 start_codon:yes stop_codon:yes gene_type:complete